MFSTVQFKKLQLWSVCGEMGADDQSGYLLVRVWFPESLPGTIQNIVYFLRKNIFLIKYILFLWLDCKVILDARNGQRIVADVLMDQEILPGVGNIIKNEACFDAGEENKISSI